jgi:superfamily II DNA or RNA helicase
MPFQSQAQSKACFAGALPGVDCEEWAAQTDYKALPKKKVKKPEPVAEKAAELQPEVELQPHQERVADRVTGPDPRLLLYHGLGSGKSLSALAAAERAGGPYGVAVPASLRGNFAKEVGKFTAGSAPETRSYTELGMGRSFQSEPETLIFDEAHRLRNPNTASSQAAQRAAAQADRVLLLTGSPITNRPSDLAPLLTLLGEPISPEAFEKKFVGQEKVYPSLLARLRGVSSGSVPYLRNERQLRRMLEGKVDYVPSAAPEGVSVQEEVVRVPAGPSQVKIENALRTTVPPKFLWKLDREFPLSQDELARLNAFLTGMRQAGLSTRPFRGDADPLTAFRQSTKLQKALADLQTTLNQDPRKKVLAYSNFVGSGVEPYQAALADAKIPASTFHGSMSPQDRQKAIDDYNAGRSRVLLLGPAGAEGISTKGTSLVQLLDPHWHESRSQQATGRGLRFDSHTDLPEELRNVAVKRYLSASQDPVWWRRLLGTQRHATGDELLERLAADKEKLNEQFREVLRSVGTAKTAAGVDYEEQAANETFTEKKANNSMTIKAADVTQAPEAFQPSAPLPTLPHLPSTSIADFAKDRQYGFSADGRVQGVPAGTPMGSPTLHGKFPSGLPLKSMLFPSAEPTAPAVPTAAPSPVGTSAPAVPGPDLLSKLRTLIQSKPGLAAALGVGGLGLGYGAYRGLQALRRPAREEKEASLVKEAVLREVADGVLDTLAASCDGEKRAAVRRIQVEFARSGNLVSSIEKAAGCSRRVAAAKAVVLGQAIVKEAQAVLTR